MTADWQAKSRQIDRQIDLADMSFAQTERAMQAMQFQPDPSSRFRFRPQALFETTRYLNRGHLVTVTAQPGIGKTTAMRSFADDFLLDGLKVAIAPLEVEDWEFRRDLAAMRAGVAPEIASENAWAEYPDGADMFNRVGRQLEKLNRPDGLLEQLLVLPYKFLDAPTMHRIYQDAEAFGADVVIIDHLRRLRVRSYDMFVEVVGMAKSLAEKHGVLSLCSSQIGRGALMGGHKLTRYQPCQLNHIEGGGVIEQESVIVLNLYRPLIIPQTPGDKELIKKAMKGEVEPRTVLQDHRTGVATLKHRITGRLEGRRCVLALVNGKLVDVPQEHHG